MQNPAKTLQEAILTAYTKVTGKVLENPNRDFTIREIGDKLRVDLGFPGIPQYYFHIRKDGTFNIKLIVDRIIKGKG